MPLTIESPSALAQMAQGHAKYSPVEIMKWKYDVDVQDRRIRENREHNTLMKLYDTGSSVLQNDYGIYDDEIKAEFMTGLDSSIEDIKSGKSAVETLKNHSPFLNKVSAMNTLNKNEKQVAMVINANKFMSAEQKASAVQDRISSIFYTDGKRVAPEEAQKRSKNMEVDINKYIDNEALYTDFLRNSQQSFRQDRVKGGTSSIQLYSWQKEDDNGNIVLDVEEDPNNVNVGLVREEVYNEFMSDAERAEAIDSKARSIDKTGDEGEISILKREIVTETLASKSDAGSKKTYTRAPIGRSGSTRVDYDQLQIMKNLQSIQTPSADAVAPVMAWDSEGEQYKGADVTGKLEAIDKRIKSAFILSDGSYLVSRSTSMGGLVKDYVKYDNLSDVVFSSANPKVQKNWVASQAQQGVSVSGYGEGTPVAGEEPSVKTGNPAKTYPAGTTIKGGTVSIAPRKITTGKNKGKWQVTVTNKNGNANVEVYETPEALNKALGGKVTPIN